MFNFTTRVPLGLLTSRVGEKGLVTTRFKLLCFQFLQGPRPNPPKNKSLGHSDSRSEKNLSTHLVPSDGGVPETVDVSFKNSGKALLYDVRSDVQVLESKVFISKG